MTVPVLDTIRHLSVQLSEEDLPSGGAVLFQAAKEMKLGCATVSMLTLKLLESVMVEKLWQEVWEF